MNFTLRRGDGFKVFTKNHLTPIDFQVLTLMYQPLMGQGALTLYLVLTSLVNRQTMTSEETLHADLESLLSQKIEKIQVYRERLEAIGLVVSTYHEGVFYYETKAPMSPYAFVNDGLLGSYLQAVLTEERYLRILALFRVKVLRTEQHTPISKSFNEVFVSLPMESQTRQSDLINGSKATISFDSRGDFDFSLFVDYLPSGFYDPEQLTESVKRKILNIVYVYGLDEMDLRDAYIRSIDDHTLAVDVKKLSYTAKDIYKQKMKKAVPLEEDELPKIQERPVDPTEYFLSVTPRTVLSDMQSGKVALQDLKNIEEVLESTQIDRHVFNVLLAYVLRIKEGKMPTYEYLEKQALSWLRDGITKVDQAMDYVKHLASEYQKRKTTPRKGQKAQPNDIEVSWLDDYLASLKQPGGSS